MNFGFITTVSSSPNRGVLCCSMIELLPMLTKYINPLGQEKEAELSVEQVEKLRTLSGYTVL